MNPDPSGKPKRINIILLGDSTVGKSSLMAALMVALKKDDASEPLKTHIATIGVDFRCVTFADHNVYIWDTAGQEKYRSIVRAYYKNADAVLMVFDVTNKDTHESVDEWMTEVVAHAPEHVQVLIVGNKSDLIGRDPNHWSVTDGESTATKYDTEFIQTSAMTGTNVETMFEIMCKRVINARKSASETRGMTLVPLNPRERSLTCRC